MANNDVTFSPRQTNAVEWDKSREILVSAAAGSGKTTVLIRRIIDRITEKRIPIDRFLVVTFTHASANELKEKISSALSKKIEEDPEDEWLRIQLANVGRASIGTMHSFCLKVIKEYHEHPAVSLPKSVRILPDEKSRELLDEAIGEVLEEEYANAENTEFFRMLDTFASFRNDDKVRSLIKELYKFALNNKEPYSWLEGQQSGTNTSSYIHAYTEIMKRTADEALELLTLCRREYQSGSVLDEMAESAYSGIENCRKLLDEDDILSASEAFANGIASVDLRKGPRKGDNPVIQKNILKAVKGKFEDILFVRYDAAPEGLSMERSLFELSRVTYLSGKRFEEKKLKNRSVDYNDMEHMTLRLFEDDSVCNMYRDKFRHIMFDEYQDCNQLQELIVKKIADNAVYFMVGDVKQSIYGFRQAEPGLFLKKYNSYQYDENAEYAKIELNENYRSRKNVLNAANKVFFKIMKQDFCGMEYCNENALNAKAIYPDHSDKTVTFADEPVRLCVVNGKGLDADSLRNAQLLYIIRTIREYRQNKLVWDAKRREYRKIRYSDMAILMRSPKKLSDGIKRMFALTEIPVNIMQDGDIRYEPELNLFICLIRCIENPYNDIALMTVLHSYIFGVTDNELLELMQYGIENTRELITKVHGYIANADSVPEELWAESGVNGELLQKLKRFVAAYSKWLEAERYMPIMSFIDELLEDTGYIEFFSAFENGVARRDNILRLYDVLKQQLAVTSGGIYECVRVLDNIDENGITGESAVGIADSVSVMSIHKSKGLEFPVVFIMDMDRAFSSEDFKATVLMHKDHGMVSRLIDSENRIEYSTAEYEVLKNIMKLEQKQEEQRILYVAMTRAREQLIMLGAMSDNAMKNMYLGDSLADIMTSNDLLDWVLYAVNADNSSPSCASSVLNLPRHAFPVKVKGEEYDSLWAFDLVSAEGDKAGRLTAINIGEERVELSSVTARGDKTAMPEGEAIVENELPAVDELIQKLSYKYPHEAATTLNSKLSVSEIKRVMAQREQKGIYEVSDKHEERVRVISSENDITPTRLGTLYHFFMQHMTVKTPYTAADFDNDIERMISRRLITEKDAKRLWKNKFISFFASDVGKRMANARWLKREQSFSYMTEARRIFPELDTDEKILIQGVVDCFFEDENGKFVLVDYKTDRASEEREDELTERYKTQLQLYKSALGDIMGINIDECYIYSFALERFI